MADSIKIYTNFTNYKNYNERMKSFVNFFMSFSNVYLHLTSKSQTVLFKTVPLSDATVEYNTENNSILITPQSDASEYQKAKLINCTLIQTSIEETDEDQIESEPILIDGIYELSNGVIVISGTDSIAPPEEGKHYVLSNPESSKCVLIPDSSLSVSIQSNERLLTEKFAILLNNNNVAKSDDGKPICDTTFTTHNTSLSLYKIEHGSTDVIKDTDFSELQCKIIPYVNGEVNTDETYIPYDAIFTDTIINNLNTPKHTIESVVEIEDNDEFSFNLRTTSFYVKSSDTSKFYDLYYKMFIASNLNDDRVTNIVTQQGISCDTSDEITIVTMIPNIYAEFGFMMSILLSIGVSESTTLPTVKSIPTRLFNLTNMNDPTNTPYAACVMLCDSETGNPITDVSDFDFSKLYMTNNIDTDPINTFFLGVRNHSIDGGHIDSVNPDDMGRFGG